MWCIYARQIWKKEYHVNCSKTFFCSTNLQEFLISIFWWKVITTRCCWYQIRNNLKSKYKYCFQTRKRYSNHIGTLTDAQPCWTWPSLCQGGHWHLACISNNVAAGEGKSLCAGHWWHHLRSCAQFWIPHCKKDIEEQSWGSVCSINLMREEQLMELGAFRLEKRRLGGTLLSTTPWEQGGARWGGRLCSQVNSDRTRDMVFNCARGAQAGHGKEFLHGNSFQSWL